MANASEIDLLTRSLSGDRRARIELYKKQFRDNSRVAKLAADYPDRSDFFHDCFTNFLRGSRTWDKEGTLASWVERIAAGTAMERTRAAGLRAQIEHGAVRLCAEVEVEDGRSLERYSPPSTIEDNSPLVCMADLLDELQAAVFQKRVIEKAGWEETAEALGKPLAAIGPAFCRVLGRVSRLTGAPPPVEEDLEPVFGRTAKDPTIPEGRQITIQLDPIFYTVTPELRKIGLNTSLEARSVVLWEAAISAEPPGAALQDHLNQCHYCADLLKSFLLLQEVLGVSADNLIFCPSACSLAVTPEKTRANFDEHCAQCTFCAAERAEMLHGEVPKAPDQPKPPKLKGEPSPRKRLAAMAAALAALILIPAGIYTYNVRSREVAEKQAPAAQHSDLLTVMVDPRLSKFVENVSLDQEAHDRVLESALPANKEAVRKALGPFSLGEYDISKDMIEPVAEKTNDPSAHLLYAMSLIHTGMMSDAYREMMTAESILPRDSLRCWIMLQFSVMVGEMTTAKREVEHLANDPKYGPRAKKLWERIQ
jgi:DNA-directed RNA polymerase specialized sigma24 family protein